MEKLLKNKSYDEIFHSHLGKAINELLQNKITAFLGYEKHSIDGCGLAIAEMNLILVV